MKNLRIFFLINCLLIYLFILFLLNIRLIGKNISAVSSKSNTTDERLEGIYTNINDKIQLVFFDTPGAIKHSDSYKSRKIVTRAWDVIIDCDKVKIKKEI